MNISTLTTAQLTDALDVTDEPWNLWRAATGLFCVSRGHGRDDPASREFSHITIDGVLCLALASPRLILIPGRPSLRHISYERQGAGSRPYKVLCDGRVELNLDRKHKAVSAVEKLNKAQHAAIDAWVDKHAYYVDTHIEGVDFYWSKQ